MNSRILSLFIFVPFFCSLHADNFQEIRDMCCCKNYPSGARIEPECSYAHLFVEGDPLYWKANDDSLFLAVSGFNPFGSPSQTKNSFTPVNANTTNFDGRIVRVKPDWDWGFHLGLGGNLPIDEWDLRIDWTRFHTQRSHSEEGDVYGVLWAHSDEAQSDASSSVAGKYHLRYDLVEINMGRDFWVGDRFSLRPNFGVRGGWINQKLIIDYTLFTSVTASRWIAFAGARDMNILSKSDFHGGGIGAGLDGTFDIYSGLMIIGRAKVHALYGEYHNKFVENSDGYTSPLLAFETDNYHNSLFGTDVSLGLSWCRYFSEDRFNLELHAMWQQVTWFSANQMDHWVHQLHEDNMNKFNSNLSLEGITFGASLYF